MNDEAVIILEGLDEGDEVLLSAPANGTTLELVRLPDSPVGRPAPGGDTVAPAPTIPTTDSAAPVQPRS
jgi:hypothetical protein